MRRAMAAAAAEDDDPWCLLLLPPLSLFLWRLELLPATLLPLRREEDPAMAEAPWREWLWLWAWWGLRLPAPVADAAAAPDREARREAALAVRPWWA